MATEGKACIIPALVYKDAAGAIEFLTDVFGFSVRARYDTDNGKVAHAELVLGDSMIMLGGNCDSEYSKHVHPPTGNGGVNTQGAYLVVDDPDDVYHKVKANGGQIVIEIKDEDYGGRGFTCLDPEGIIWSVGSYDPWHTEAVKV